MIGAIAYSRATFGVASAWPLASGLVAYSGTLLLGFVNFVAAIGIALLLAAGWIAWRERYPLRTVALAGAGTVALFFCHLMGLVFFYVLIAGYELVQFWCHRCQWTALRARVLALLPVFGLPFGLYLISPLAPLPADTEFASIAEKARELIFPFANYFLPLDIVAAGTVLTFLIACIATRRCRITPGAGFTLALVGGLFLATPWAYKGTYFLDTRFAIMLGFLLFGAVLPMRLPRAARLAAVTVFTLLFAVAWRWLRSRGTVTGTTSRTCAPSSPRWNPEPASSSHRCRPRKPPAIGAAARSAGCCPMASGSTTTCPRCC